MGETCLCGSGCTKAVSIALRSKLTRNAWRGDSPIPERESQEPLLPHQQIMNAGLPVIVDAGFLMGLDDLGTLQSRYGRMAE